MFAGPRLNLTQGWSLVSKGLKIEPPTPLGVYLGCGHDVREIKLPNGKVRVVSYNMEAFLTSCVDRYLELAGSGYKLRQAATPFLVDDPANSPAAAPQPGSNGVACPWCKHTFDAKNANATTKSCTPRSAPGAHDNSKSGGTPSDGELAVAT